MNTHKASQKLQRRHFFKKTRRGKVHRMLGVIRLVREKYLQPHVGMGFIGNNMLMKDKLIELVSSAPHKHLLVLDTNVCIKDIDLFEVKCPATSLIVILQTVLQEIQHIDVSVYRRLMLLMKDESRSFIFFPNEVAVETSQERLAGESDNDFNDRLIRDATSMYRDAVETENGCKVFLLSNDVENRRRASTDGIAALSIHNYLRKYLKDYPELMDLLSATGDDNDHRTDLLSKQRAPLYPPHVAMTDILAGLRNRTYYRCTIRCSGRSSTSAEPWKSCYTVIHKPDGTRLSVAIHGESNVNRAVDGDVVAIELLSGSEDCESNQVFAPEVAPPAGVAEVFESTAEASASQIEGLSVPTDAVADNSVGRLDRDVRGRVVGVIRRNWRQYAGSLVPLSSMNYAEGKNIQQNTNEIQRDVTEEVDHESENSSEAALFVPLDNKLPKVLIHTRRLDELMKCRVLISIDNWPMHSPFPIGHFVRSFGSVGIKDVETSVLLHEFEVPYESFSPAVMACLPPTTWSITPDIIAARTDLRHLPIVSIDPPGCKDIDDALHCRRLPNGNLEVGVHIADVSYFVESGSALDVEAQHRSTSTYLVERRLDMLPGYLTTQLCSLRSNEDHLCFSVIWEMDDDANILDVSYCKSCIHSVASMTYDEAQAILDDPSRDDKICSSVRLLNMLAVKLRQRRRDAGALTLASTEVRFKLDAETSDPTDVTAYNLKASNALVEEWMLIANITVAKKILRHYPTLAILRRHQPPARTQFASLLEAAAAVGVDLNIDSSKTLADSLDAAVRDSDPNFNKLLRILSTRCMMPAQYFCSGELPKDQWHHYGLATPVYTHFTSPIRRYADLLVHRLLAAAINVTSLPVANADRSRQHEICTHMNRRHKAAQHIQRASVNLHSVLFFANHPVVEPAYILSVCKDRINVIAPKYGIESSIDMMPIVAYVKKQHGSATDEPDSSWVNFDAKACRLSIVHGADKATTYHDFKVFDQVSIYISVLKACPDEGRPTSTLIINLVFDGKVFHDDGCIDLADIAASGLERKYTEQKSSNPAKTSRILNNGGASGQVDTKKRKSNENQLEDRKKRNKAT